MRRGLGLGSYAKTTSVDLSDLLLPNGSNSAEHAAPEIPQYQACASSSSAIEDPTSAPASSSCTPSNSPHVSAAPTATSPVEAVVPQSSNLAAVPSLSSSDFVSVPQRKGEPDRLITLASCFTWRMVFTALATAIATALIFLADFIPLPHTTASTTTVTMRDGVGLATNIFLPSAHGMFPTIFVRTLFNSSEVCWENTNSSNNCADVRSWATLFNKEGFAVVVQDVRGRGQSQGTFTAYVNEGNDGYDTLEWIKRRKWSNGRVAVMGSSYAAHAQLSATCLSPPNLHAVVLSFGGFNGAFTSGMRLNGSFCLHEATFRYALARSSQETATNATLQSLFANTNVRDWVVPSTVPWASHQSPVWVESYEADLVTAWQHNKFDAFWQTQSLTHASCEPLIDHPLGGAVVTGWFDASVVGAIDNFLAWHKHSSDVSLVVGPWTWPMVTQTHGGDVWFGDDATFAHGVGQEIQNWERLLFNKFLKGVGAFQEGVFVFVMGGGSGMPVANLTGKALLDHGGFWVKSSHFPLSHTSSLMLLLDAANMTLVHQSDTNLAPATATMTVDPCNPVPTVGGASSVWAAPILLPGAFNQVTDERFFPYKAPFYALDSREDVLVFRSEPLTEAVVVVGCPQLFVAVSTNGTDVDITAKLVDEYPPSQWYPHGFAMNVADGIARARFREGNFSAPKPMQPGVIYDNLSVSLHTTANLFQAGHRIRVDVSWSSFPKFDLTTGFFPSDQNHRCPQQQMSLSATTVHTGHTQTNTKSAAVTAPRLLLPVVPLSLLNRVETVAT